jgi:hypothetical protein
MGHERSSRRTAGSTAKVLEADAASLAFLAAPRSVSWPATTTRPGRDAERQYPYRVDIPVQSMGLGKQLNDMLEWCSECFTEWTHAGVTLTEPAPTLCLVLMVDHARQCR